MEHTDKKHQNQDEQQDAMNETDFDMENYSSAAEEMDSETESMDSLTETSEADMSDSPTHENVILLSKQLEQTKEQMMRALAEAENTRRRSQKEREDVRKYAISDFAKDLLEFSDNFRRAIDSFPEDLKTNEKVGGVISGIEAMEKTLLKTFEKHGIEKLEPMDEVFNPNFHEVMFEAGRTISVLISPNGEEYILISRDANRTTDIPLIPPTWQIEERVISEELTLELPNPTLNIRAENNQDSWQGPVDL